MTRKTLTISKEAYESLKHLKKENESFTDVILRLTRTEKIGKLSELIKKIAPDDELASDIEKASKRMRGSR
jgi:predicted CopG family antitoxin